MSAYSDAIDIAARLMLHHGFEHDEARAAELQAGSTNALLEALRLRTGGAEIVERGHGEAVMSDALARAREIVNEIDVVALIAGRH